MKPDQMVLDLEARAAAAELQMVDILKRAGVGRSTWWRWRQGKRSPQLSTLRKVEAALIEEAA